MVAPTIISLHGRLSAEDAAKSEMSVAHIKDKVWDMCSHVQDRLAEGYTRMAIRKGGYVYSYKVGMARAFFFFFFFFFWRETRPTLRGVLT